MHVVLRAAGQNLRLTLKAMTAFLKRQISSLQRPNLPKWVCLRAQMVSSRCADCGGNAVGCPQLSALHQQQYVPTSMKHDSTGPTIWRQELLFSVLPAWHLSCACS